VRIFTQRKSQLYRTVVRVNPLSIVVVAAAAVAVVVVVVVDCSLQRLTQTRAAISHRIYITKEINDEN